MITVAIALGATLIGVFALNRNSSRDSLSEKILLHTVERGDFEAFVTEPGDLVSSSNVDVRCKVKSRGTAGSAIVRICEEGTQVEPGDFLVEFDDSLLQTELIAQQIVVANDQAALIQAQSDQANAERTLREYSEGLFQQECDVLESAVFVAEEELRKSEFALESAERMAAKGMLRPLQVSAAKFAVEKCTKDVAAAKRALDVYKDFTKDKTVGEYQAEIEKQKANVEAARFTLELSQQRMREIEEQIVHCHVVAPARGQVVYANERYRGEPMVVEEGTVIRYHQVIVRLPDIQRMQVDVKINESHVNRIRPGQSARIILDADPENVLEGEVVSVAPFPFPMRWHGAPLEYGVEVAIINPPSTIRPGLRAKVKIFFEFQPNVIRVPLASVIANQEEHFCLVRLDDNWHLQKIEIGSSNNNEVVVKNGLTGGEKVTLTPFRYIKRSELPKPSNSRDSADVASDADPLEQKTTSKFTSVP